MNPFHRPRGYGYRQDFPRGGMQQHSSFVHQPQYGNLPPPPLQYGYSNVDNRLHAQQFPLSGRPSYSQHRTQQFSMRGGQRQGNPQYFDRAGRDNSYRPRGRGYGNNQFSRNQFDGKSDQGIACYFKPSMLEDPWSELMEKVKQSEKT